MDVDEQPIEDVHALIQQGRLSEARKLVFSPGVLAMLDKGTMCNKKRGKEREKSVSTEEDTPMDVNGQPIDDVDTLIKQGRLSEARKLVFSPGILAMLDDCEFFISLTFPSNYIVLPVE